MINARNIFVTALVLCALGLGSQAFAGMSKGQTLYVPCSSHVYHGAKTRPFELTVTLTVRNVDTRRAMKLVSVDYVGTDGRVLKRFVAKTESVHPLATREYVVEQNDTSGGAGASFLVRWQADAPMNEPVTEAVMIGTANSQGISFTSRGVVVQE